MKQTKFLIELGLIQYSRNRETEQMCSTSVKSGIGIGQVDAIIRALKARKDHRKQSKDNC